MKSLTAGSLFTGIGGFDEGFRQAGIETLWQVEIDNDANRVLERRWPDVQRFKDVRECGKHNLVPVDVICFGSPCQDLSIAGKRGGLGAERSGLFFEAMRIVRELGPTFVVWENVPGALSSNAGRDFVAILNAFRELGARDICWTVLDAQYFGVAQRRKRVFLVADFGGERASEILFESSRMCGHSAPSREKGPGVTGAIETGAGISCRGGYDGAVAACLNSGGNAGGFRSEPGEHLVAGTLASHSKRHGHAMTTQQAAESNQLIAHTLRGEGFDASEDGTGRGTPLVVADVAGCLQERDWKGPDSETKEGHLIVQELARPLKSGGNDRHDESHETYVVCDSVAAPITASYGKQADNSDRNGGPPNIIAFAQNCRDELRVQGDGEISGALAGQPGMKQQTFIAYALQGAQVGRSDESGPQGKGYQEEVSFTLDSRTEADVVAFRACGQDGFMPGPLSPPLVSSEGGGNVPTIAFTERSRADDRTFEAQEELAYALTDGGAGGNPHSRKIANQCGVRRLTPRECERLQAFPDDWTLYDAQGKVISDSARYRLTGNAVVTNVARWIGRRILELESQ